MTDARTIVVVGASLGGLRAVESLRRLGWEENILVIGDEEHMPYTRPPLSKKLLIGGGTVEDVLLRQRPSDLPTTWKLGCAVVGSDLAAKRLDLADGTQVSYDGLVAATGVSARRLPGDTALGHRQTVRTFDDSITAAAKLTAGARVVIIGAGFIGCEVAAAAKQHGCQVTVVAVDALPMLIPLGSLVGTELLRRHEATGVAFHLGRTVTSFEHGDTTDTVVLDDGTRLEADLVVEAIGSIPNTGWLAGNGLDLADGVLCDPHLRIVGADTAVAVGDVARFPHRLLSPQARRIEHWQVAADTALIAAGALLHDLGASEKEPSESTALPTFWSDQGVASIRAFGAPPLGDEVTVLEGDLSGEVAIGYSRGGTLVGVVLLGMAKESGRFIKLVTEALAPTDG